MVITTTTTIVNNIYTASIATDPNTVEVAYMEAYGEPQINIGGSIPYVDGSGHAQTVVLPNETVSIRSNSPFVHSFNTRCDANAKYEVIGWVTQVIALITAAKTALITDNPAPNSPDVVTQVI